MTLPKGDYLAGYCSSLVSAQPITDPTTDRSEEAASEAYASVAAMTHTAIRSWCQFRFHVDNKGEKKLELKQHDAVWGNASAVAPVLTHEGPGIFTLTWPTSIVDELGDTQSVNTRTAWTSVFDGGDEANRHVQCSPTSANEVTVYSFTLQGVLADPIDSLIDVFTL